MPNKTQAMRILEHEGIKYNVCEYSKTETDAMRVAAAIGANPNEVFKTLVAQREARKPLLAMIPSNKILDLKKLAKILGEKKIKMASLQEAERITGMQKGGISAIPLLNRGFDTMIDTSVLNIENIFVSAGKRGIQIQLRAKDLLTVTNARIMDIAR